MMNIGNFVVKTSFDHPPMPIRSSDWSAWCDGHEEWLVGRGATELEAICDLNQRLTESGHGEKAFYQDDIDRLHEELKVLQRKARALDWLDVDLEAIESAMSTE